MKKILVILIVLALGGFLYLQTQNKPKEVTKMGNTKKPIVETIDKKEMNDMEKDMKASYMDISPMKAKELIDSMPEIIIIDVSNIYDEGHIPGAINYYVGGGSLDEAIPTLDKNATYLVYCHVDSASIAGANKLIEAGFESVYRLEGNYSAWVEAGYEIER